MNLPFELSEFPRIPTTAITRYSNELVLMWNDYYYNRVTANKKDKYISLFKNWLIEKDPYFRPRECKDNSEYYKFLDNNFIQIVYQLSSSFTWAKYRISSEVKLNFDLPIETDEAIVEIQWIIENDENTQIKYNFQLYTINLVELLGKGEFIDF